MALRGFRLVESWAGAVNNASSHAQSHSVLAGGQMHMRTVQGEFKVCNENYSFLMTPLSFTASASVEVVMHDSTVSLPSPRDRGQVHTRCIPEAGSERPCGAPARLIPISLQLTGLGCCMVRAHVPRADSSIGVRHVRPDETAVCSTQFVMTFILLSLPAVVPTSEDRLIFRGCLRGGGQVQIVGFPPQSPWGWNERSGPRKHGESCSPWRGKQLSPCFREPLPPTSLSRH